MINNNTQAILKFLRTKANNNINPQALEAVIAFLHTDTVLEILPIIAEKIKCDIDFNSYFESMEQIEELKALKTEDPDKYYQIIYYETILINIICKALDIPYTIVLKPDDLDGSYYLMIKFK